MIESLSLHLDTPPPSSHITGSNQFNTIWTTPNLKLSRLSVLSYYFRIRDHCIIIADFLIDFFMSNGFNPIVKYEMRWLTSAQSKAAQNYLRRAQNLQ